MSRGARREALLDAALVAFSRGGYHGTHVDDVIREADVARGTFYLHFDSKHDVFAALVDRMLSLFLAARPAEPDPDVSTRADAERLLARSYRTVLSTFREHRLLCRLLLEEAVGLDKGFRTRLDRHYREWHRRVAETLEHLRDRGVVRKDVDVEVTAELVVGMVERVTRRYLFRDAAPDLERLVSALVAFELGGTGR
jgi:AcrR family transcriptional regulator